MFEPAWVSWFQMQAAVRKCCWDNHNLLFPSSHMSSLFLFNHWCWHSLPQCPVAPLLHSVPNGSAHSHPTSLHPTPFSHTLLNMLTQRYTSTYRYMLLTFCIPECLPSSEPQYTDVSVLTKPETSLPPIPGLQGWQEKFFQSWPVGRMQTNVWVRKLWTPGCTCLGMFHSLCCPSGVWWAQREDFLAVHMDTVQTAGTQSRGLMIAAA